ncbi:hypothetical protein [Halomonas sp. 328]|uniref:hypothetical protein n=1 Tax=Halomonas sp. 328 TaxID=2776704 RepID=UPI0018A7113E|nr:hypothetical protein [Halomonas sp. 328]MBF8224208.1 hypothetical protein [Halomonas sp. 328]
MNEVLFSTVIVSTPDGDPELYNIAYLPGDRGLRERLASDFGDSGAGLIRLGAPLTLQTLERQGRVFPWMRQLGANVSDENPVILRRLNVMPTAPDASLSPSEARQDGFEEAPIVPMLIDAEKWPVDGPLLVVFNVSEAWSAYRHVRSSRWPFVRLCDYAESKYPCTIGVPFDHWNDDAKSLCDLAATSYVIEQVPDGLAPSEEEARTVPFDYAKQILINFYDPKIMCLATGEIDPLAEEHGKEEATPTIVRVINGDRLFYRRYEEREGVIDFPRENGAYDNDPILADSVALLTRHALLETYLESRDVFVDAPSHVRSGLGLADVSAFVDEAEFNASFFDDAHECIRLYICHVEEELHYSEILFLVNALCVSAGERESVVARFKELLAAPPVIGLREKLNLFYVEAISSSDTELAAMRASAPSEAFLKGLGS